jgi:putative transposase
LIRFKRFEKGRQSAVLQRSFGQAARLELLVPLIWSISRLRLRGAGMSHSRGQPYHPMTQGKIERYHRSLKNRILLEHYYLPGQLEARLAAFVDFYNTRRYHESLGHLTPADIYSGRGPTILARRRSIKHQTIELRRRLHQQAVA